MHVPLRPYAHHEARLAAGAARALTVQLIERPAGRVALRDARRTGRPLHRLPDGRPGEIVVGVASDMGEAFAASRATYRPACEELALDFGLATMFASDQGDLLGRSWRRELERHDHRIAGLAARLQAQGLRPNRSRRYRERVESFRGYLKEAIGRVLNRVVGVRRPGHVVVERLDFRAPGLSRRLNRLLARSGRAVVRAKLQDLADRFGITHAEVNPACPLQTCSAPSCGHVAKTNRRSQSAFVCACCGNKIHADVNAARNLRTGRSSFDRAARLTKAGSLRETVHRHLERLKARDRVIPAAVRRSPYYRGLTAAADVLLTRIRPPPVVADVSAG